MAQPSSGFRTVGQVATPGPVHQSQVQLVTHPAQGAPIAKPFSETRLQHQKLVSKFSHTKQRQGVSPNHPYKSLQNGLMSSTDKLYSIELISPVVAVPVGFTDSLTVLPSLATQMKTCSLAKSRRSSGILYCEQRRQRSGDEMNVYVKQSFLGYLVDSCSVPAEHGGLL